MYKYLPLKNLIEDNACQEKGYLVSDYLAPEI